MAGGAWELDADANAPAATLVVGTVGIWDVADGTDAVEAAAAVAWAIKTIASCCI